jgi:hypothetical protein
MAEDRLHGTIAGNDCPFAKKKTAFEELAMNSREYFLSFPYAAWKPGMAVVPDWLLGGLFGLGGIGGMYCGARLKKTCTGHPDQINSRPLHAHFGRKLPPALARLKGDPWGRPRSQQCKVARSRRGWSRSFKGRPPCLVSPDRHPGARPGQAPPFSITAIPRAASVPGIHRHDFIAPIPAPILTIIMKEKAFPYQFLRRLGHCSVVVDNQNHNKRGQDCLFQGELMAWGNSSAATGFH